MLIIFITIAALALCLTRTNRRTKQPLPLLERLAIFSRGAGERNLLQMLWVFVLAGAFAHSAKAMGAIDAMVNLTLSFTPPSVLLVGLFLSALFVSLGIGTSVGTVVAITPFAAALAESAGLNTAMMVASVVGGALFGDNLSFISDTTIAATQTQGIPMRDKFIANLRSALPAALLTAILYVVIGIEEPDAPIEVGEVNLIHIIPYIYVLVAALAGMQVLIVLFTANILTGIIGIATGGYSFVGWIDAMTEGIGGMGELILISMVAGGLMELFRYNGGITRLILVMRRHINGPKGAALAIGALVSLVDLCTANNTIAILSVGYVARDIADMYGVSRRRSASMLDTFSCAVQGLLPYGAQLLMAAGIAELNPLHLVPYLFYPMILLVCAVGVILFMPDKPLLRLETNLT